MNHKQRHYNNEEFDQCTNNAKDSLLMSVKDAQAKATQSQMKEQSLLTPPTPIPPPAQLLSSSTTTLTGTNLELNNKRKDLKTRISVILHAKLFHLIIVILCALDGLLVICMLLLEIESLKLKPSPFRSRLILTSFIFECTSFAIVTLFLIEIPIKLWAFGARFYCHQWIEMLDAFVCIVSFAVDTYNIHRHVTHSKDTDEHYKPHGVSGTNDHLVNKSVQATIADAAGLLVLFRLWRVIRIVNAIVVSVTATHERTVKCLKAAQTVSQKRIEQLEQLLQENNIPIPPLSPKSQSILMKKT
ncbi:unnamed protein product [Trichobilharzia szidati]|nr:unnamed protein product [Trichobilharzia szidati]